MTIEFETVEGATITAPVSAVLYVRNDNKHYHVVMASDDSRGLGWKIDQANYAKIRAAIRGYDQANTQEEP